MVFGRRRDKLPHTSSEVVRYTRLMSGLFSVGINAYEANVAKRVGSNLYAYKILCELERLTRSSLQPAIEWVVYLPSAPLFDMPKERVGFRYVICPPKRLWTMWRLPLELFLRGRSHHVLLNLGHYASRFSPVAQVICILDLAYIKFPQFFLKKDLYQLTTWTARSSAQAKHIFTISNSAKTDIIELYKKKPEDITIAYPGVEIQRSEARGQGSEFLEKYKLEEKKYFVALGTIQPRKNITSVIKAFEVFNQSHENLWKLVLVGKSGWMTDEFDRVLQESTQRESIVVTGYVEDEEKWSLLSHAGASILVGYYEGFGIPAIESMSVGVQPIVANTASLPEVVGEYGIQVDPYSVESITHGMEQVSLQSMDPMTRSQMILWAEQFSWEKSAQKMLEVLQQKFYSI